MGESSLIRSEQRQSEETCRNMCCTEERADLLSSQYPKVYQFPMNSGAYPLLYVTFYNVLVTQTHVRLC